MPQKKSDGRGWFFESMRHSLASKGVKTGQKQKPARKPLVGRYAKPWPKREEGKPLGGKTLLEQTEKDPEKRWLWGVKLKPAQKKEIVREAAREPIAPAAPAEEEKPQRLHITMKQEEKKPETPKPGGVNPQELEAQAKAKKTEAAPAPPQSVMKQRSKSKKAKFESVEQAWDAAQDELAARYGDSGSSTGVVHDDDEAEQKLARNMGVH